MGGNVPLKVLTPKSGHTTSKDRVAIGKEVERGAMTRNEGEISQEKEHGGRFVNGKSKETHPA